jgi:hypothetical protein
VSALQHPSRDVSSLVHRTMELFPELAPRLAAFAGSGGKPAAAALRTIAAQGVGILLGEQFTTLALASANRAYVPERGRLTFDGPAATQVYDPTILHAALGDYRLVGRFHVSSNPWAMASIKIATRRGTKRRDGCSV